MITQTKCFNSTIISSVNLLFMNNYLMLKIGRPSPAQFRSEPYSRSRNSYNITWLLESYPPLEEVRLLYRKMKVSKFIFLKLFCIFYFF